MTITIKGAIMITVGFCIFATTYAFLDAGTRAYEGQIRGINYRYEEISVPRVNIFNMPPGNKMEVRVSKGNSSMEFVDNSQANSISSLAGGIKDLASLESVVLTPLAQPGPFQKQYTYYTEDANEETSYGSHVKAVFERANRLYRTIRGIIANRVAHQSRLSGLESQTEEYAKIEQSIPELVLSQ